MDDTGDELTSQEEDHPRSAVAQFFADYSWFIIKNIIGWVLILAAWPIGVALPGPGGIPIFLIGFALITFPGKRKLTAGVMRGRPMDLRQPVFGWIILGGSFLLPVLGLLVVRIWYSQQVPIHRLSLLPAIALGAASWGLGWVIMRFGLRLLNVGIRGMPMVRRKIRPWLRHRGINLLPPRRTRRNPNGEFDLRETDAVTTTDEIIEIHERHHNRMRWLWQVSKPWIRRGLSVGITVAIFVWIFKPIVQKWPVVREQVLAMNPMHFIIASGMFAVFLFCFRVLAWRAILIGFGHKLPVAAATRIWSTSELTRYVPGGVLQFVGRVYLSKPYGISGRLCSTSQLLELAIFLLANVLVAVPCMLFLGTKVLPDDARPQLYMLMGLVPALVLLLHPKVFYSIINWVLARIRKAPVTQRLGSLSLAGLLFWTVFGLLWQSLAVWLIVYDSLELPLAKWWVVAGGYCFAWCVGFLAFWSPAGLGVREAVFITAMQVALPPAVRDQFADPEALLAFLAFLSVILRLWATAGELVLATLSYVLDYRGAINDPDAPGRVPLTSSLTEAG